MYIPPEYRETDRDTLLAFMRAQSFATLVSYDGEKPIATHLPFVIKSDDKQITLVTHMARANKQWRSFGEQEALVIFQGPHGYVSPTNYEDKARVPTWNYIAVHAYGKIRVTSFDEHDGILRAMIDAYEPSYVHQYESLPADYKLPNMGAIACIEITVSRLEGSYKLSQDKSEDDRARVAHSLSASNDTSARATGEEMKRRL